MRPLSRLLSVFLALILMGLSVATASADETADADGDSYATMSVVMVDPPDAIYPGDELKFMITVYRLGAHNVTAATVVGPDTTQTSEDIATAFAIYAEDTEVGGETIATSTFHEAEVTYVVPTLDSGVSSRTLTLEWTLVFTATHITGATGTDHSVLEADSKVTASDSILIETRPAAEGGATQVVLDFGDPVVPDIEKGKEIEFSLTVTTGDYRYRGGSFLIMKQVKDDEGEDDGVALPVAAMTIAELKTNSTSSDIEAKYKLSQADVDALDDGGSIEFSYEHDINEIDLDKSDTLDVTAASAALDTYGTDFNKDGMEDDKVETSKGVLLVLPVAAPAPEATPEPAVGMTESATVTKGEGNLIDITRHDGGADFSLGVGVLTADGMLEPHMNGYIRDNDLGQTYAVVTRESDGMIVRVWISSSSPHVGDIDWSSVLDFYNVPKDVVNAIPLDHTAPSANQLVDAGGTWYAYTGGHWRHIPDIPTFQSRGFYYCDLTTAAAGWADNIDLGQPIPSVGGEEDPDYPVCHS